jgi:hypothetical protein
MREQHIEERLLIEKIRALPQDRIAEVEDFVDFLAQRDQDRLMARAAAKLSEDVFQKAWDNQEDAAYDRL